MVRYSYQFPRGKARYLWHVLYDINHPIDGYRHMNVTIYLDEKTEREAIECFKTSVGMGEPVNIWMHRHYICPQCKTELQTSTEYQVHSCTDNPAFVKQLQMDGKRVSDANLKRQAFFENR